MRIWYMRDNHTFLSLPNNVEMAMIELRRSFIDEHDTYGMLCTQEGPMSGANAHAGKDWQEFCPRARCWIEAALQPTAAEIEYASWAQPPNVANNRIAPAKTGQSEVLPGNSG